ncbi:MAG TPA: hypothetical protein PKA64_06010 [Myxococcota bacterium]|nr:hypothetical protein [Myxococcota bacterium]
MLCLLLAACGHAGEECCAVGDGWAWVEKGTCAASDRALKSVCDEGVGDPDDVGDTTPEGLCQDFCAGILRVCPEDSACVESCETYATEVPSREAIDCAAEAPDCRSTGECWGMIGL